MGLKLTAQPTQESRALTIHSPMLGIPSQMLPKQVAKRTSEIDNLDILSLKNVYNKYVQK